MSDPYKGTPSVWGPGACRAAVSVTFDNLGEAADLERGLWPESEPLGRHFSVRRMLPRILGMLDELGLRATFFIEGLNAELYPDALLEIANSGHELGYHGWRHEYWPNLSPSNEARVLDARTRRPAARFSAAGRENDPFLARIARKPRFYPLLASGPRDRLPRQLGRPAVRVATDRRLLLSATLRRTSEDRHRFERAAVSVPFPGDAKIGAARCCSRRWAPNPGIPSVPRRTGRPLRDYVWCVRRTAGSSRRWVGLVRTAPGRGFMGPRTPRSFRQWAPARLY